MEKHEEALWKFIDEMQYLENDDVLGIVFYGSYLSGYYNKNSDIDIHVIMSENVKELYRAACVVDGYKIEYFEKPINDLYESVENDFLSQDNALVPIIGYAKVLFDRSGNVAKLQKQVIDKYSNPLPPLSIDEAKEIAVIIDNALKYLYNMIEKPYFNYQYNIVVEKIRKFYSKLCGCPNIPVVKAIRIYTDLKYRESFHKSNIPDETFIQMWLNVIGFNGGNLEKMKLIKELYDYATRNLNIDPNNYRIQIKSRNDPRNKVHE